MTLATVDVKVSTLITFNDLLIVEITDNNNDKDNNVKLYCFSVAV